MTDKIPLTRNEVKNYDILVTRPIFVKNIYNEVGSELHSALQSIILKTGDEWKRRLTVVQANITNLNMHGRYKEFKTISDIVLTYAEKMGSTPIKCRTSDCWGVLYKKKDFAVAHAHWPNIWSWGYYVKVPQGSSPLVFPEGKEGNYYVFPQVGDLVIFPAWVKHEVPPSTVDEDRMLVGGNIERIPHKDLPLPSTEEIKKVVVPTTKPIFGKRK
jgi:hypothetical protein